MEFTSGYGLNQLFLIRPKSRHKDREKLKDCIVKEE